MIKEELNKQLFDKIPQNAKIAIFGACSIGGNILKDILLKRSDVEILCFIDNRKQGDFLDLPIYGLKEFIDKNLNTDLVIVASLSAQYIVNDILNIYDINYIPISRFVIDYYEGNHTLLNDKNYSKVINILEDAEDKKLYDILFKAKKYILPVESVKNYIAGKYSDNFIEYPVFLKKHYLEYINMEKINIIFDLGYNQGTNEIAINKLIPNYKEIHAFEPIYNLCRDDMIENFAKDNRTKIIPNAVSDTIGKFKFYINPDGAHIDSQLFYKKKESLSRNCC